jgi:hypothetical protein
MSTLFAGLSTLPRTIMYVAAQITGAVVGAYWLRLGLGEESYFPLVIYTNRHATNVHR